MRPSEVREHVLYEHETIRAMLEILENRARQVAAKGSGPLVGPLRLEGETLLETLLTHMRWEDRFLRPALLEADAWGEERAALLDRDHKEQREMLAFVLGMVRDLSRPRDVIARNLLDLVRLLNEDMEDEEQVLLDERVLRDDVVAIEVESG